MVKTGFLVCLLWLISKLYLSANTQQIATYMVKWLSVLSIGRSAARVYTVSIHLQCICRNNDALNRNVGFAIGGSVICHYVNDIVLIAMSLEIAAWFLPKLVTRSLKKTKNQFLAACIPCFVVVNFDLKVFNYSLKITHTMHIRFILTGFWQLNE